MSKKGKTMSNAEDVCDKLRSMVSAKGANLYGGEQVTQEQHALQAAQLAHDDECPDHIVVAALLHDVGHLLEPDFSNAMASDVDRVHETIGEKFLKRWFGPDVTEPVRLHVAAKRYLCATRPDYFETLSPASVHSLALQGGPMSPEETKAFEAEPHARDAVKVRLYDDLAKDPAMTTRDLEHFLGRVKRCMR